jgi:hypothetical protein
MAISLGEIQMDKDVNQVELPKAMQEQEQEEVTGIIITKDRVSNMDMERIMVAGFAVVDILQRTRLSQSAQEEAVDRLVDRTPNFLKLKEEERVEKIKAVLIQETVIEYLRHEGIIREKVDMVDSGVDEEGSVVVTAYYTHVSREIRRALKKQYDEDQMRKAEAAINILQGDDKLVDLAAARLRKMQAQAQSPASRKFKSNQKKKNNFSKGENEHGRTTSKTILQSD